MLRAVLLLLTFCLLSFAPRARAQLQLRPVDPISYQNELRQRIAQLAQQEREIELAGRPPGYHGQLIAAAAIGGLGVVTGGGALIAASVTAFSSSGPSLGLTRNLMIAGFSTVGVAGLWAIVLTTVRKVRTDRKEMLRLREQRRALKLEYQRVERGYYPPATLSLLLDRQQVGLRVTF